MNPKIGSVHPIDSGLKSFQNDFVKSRRGLSTVITSAMMLSAVAILGSALVSLSNSNFKTFETSFTNATASYSNQINEDLNIENVWFGSSPSKFVNITLTNIGTVSLNVIDIKIVNSTRTYDYPYSHSNILPKRQNSTIISYNWQSGVPIQIVVTTSRGSTFQTQVTHS